MDHDELQSATTQLNEMMQDLLQKMSLQDKEWQKVLQNLFIDMDSKVAGVCRAGGEQLWGREVVGWVSPHPNAE